MIKTRLRIFVAIGVLVAGLVLSEASAVVLAAPDIQAGQAGQVTIKATWQGAEAGPVFTVVLDAHAVNLDAYDLVQLAALRTDWSDEVLLPVSWDAPAGGHHRQGTLVFPITRLDGSAVLAPETRLIELSIRDVGGVPETVLRWVVP
jgi:hypothetical protein